jgi:hypothetical protein
MFLLFTESARMNFILYGISGNMEMEPLKVKIDK